METSSKGIWIPEELWQNEGLTIMEKLFLIKINGLDGAEGCYASNKYFGEYFKLSRSRCSVIIKSLKDKGYILIKYSYEKGKELIERRVIKIKTTLFKVVKEIKSKASKVKEALMVSSEKKKIECLELSRSNRSRNIARELGDIDEYYEYEGYEAQEDYGLNNFEEDEGEDEKEELNEWGEVGGVEEDRELEADKSYFETIEEELLEHQAKLDILGESNKGEKLENVSSHNKFKVKKSEEDKNNKKSLYQEIVGYLNIKCNKNYKYTTGKTQRCINARLREGYSLEDFKRVIDKKHFEWSKTSMKIYLRPETLFGTKFERYLMEERIEKENHYSSSIWRGGQAYGKQFKNVRNSGEDKEDKEGSSFSNTEPLTDEEREWAERELF